MRTYAFVAYFLLLLITTSCQQKTEKQIIGTWEIVDSRIENIDKYIEQFKDKYQATDEEIEREKTRIQSLPEAYYPTGITMSFKENGVYDLGGISGKWTYDEKTGKLTISLTTLDKSDFIIKKISRNRMVLIYPFQMAGVDLDFELVLERVKDEE